VRESNTLAAPEIQLYSFRPLWFLSWGTEQLCVALPFLCSLPCSSQLLAAEVCFLQLAGFFFFANTAHPPPPRPIVISHFAPTQISAKSVCGSLPPLWLQLMLCHTHSGTGVNCGHFSQSPRWVRLSWSSPLPCAVQAGFGLGLIGALVSLHCITPLRLP